MNVVWSEPFISCSGSVSQYVLSVTPPTSECGSGSEDCVLVTDQTHYDLTLTVDQTYNLTVRADTCTNTLTGDYSDPLSINTGQSISYTTYFLSLPTALGMKVCKQLVMLSTSTVQSMGHSEQ